LGKGQSNPWLSDEKRLLQGCLAQDKKSWDAFVDKYSRLISHAIARTLRKYSHSTENQIVEDLFHTVFLSLIENNSKKLRQFQWRCKLSGWLVMIATNMTIDFLRKQKDHLSLNGESAEEVPLKDKIPNGNPLPDQIIDEQEERIIFEQIKNGLTSRERLFVELYYCRDLSADEVANVLNTTKNNVYQLNNRVRLKMQEMVKEYL